VCTEGNDHLRLNYLNLPLEVRQAAYDLLGPRVAVLRRAAFQYVADEDIFPFEPAGFDDLVQELACPADKRPALRIFIGARGFAHEHDAGIGIAFTRHGVGPRRAQAALAALTNLRRNLLKLGGFRRNSHIIPLLPGLRLCTCTLGSKTGEELLHLKVLANNLPNIHVFFHHDGF
jgi:hypothetical protein